MNEPEYNYAERKKIHQKRSAMYAGIFIKKIIVIIIFNNNNNNKDL